MVLLHLPLEDAPHGLNRVQVWRHTWSLHHLQQQGSCHLGGVFVVVIMLENSFWRECIIFCFRVSQYMLESMFPQWTAAPQYQQYSCSPRPDATTTTLDCRQGTIFLTLLTRALPHMLDTIWVKQVYLRLIRPQGMAPVIHALDQAVFSKLFAGFFVSQLQKRLPSGTNWLVAVCGIWSEHWQANLPLLRPLKQCWQHSCVCFFQPASVPDAQHKDSTYLIDPFEACSEWNPSTSFV